MGIGAKLALVGAAGAAAIAALGAASVAYNYFFDKDQGSARRKTSLDLAKSMAEKTGLGGMDKELMSSFMNKLATK